METLPKPSPEYWWLIGLEATLFFSLPCWENTARWSWPAANPAQFAAFVISAATIAMLCCHIGPAMCAAKFGARPHVAWWVPAIWLSAGYLEWLGTPVRTLGPYVYLPHVLRRPLEIAFLFAVLIAITVVAWVGPLWKYAGVACLAFSIGVLTWLTATSWPGLSVHNPSFGVGEPYAHDWVLVKGMLLSAAPALLISWRLGPVESRPSQVWLSGILGLWLPIVVSVTLASLAAMAGARAHYRPSLPGGFYWAMQGTHGRLEKGAIVLTSLTILGPALLAAVCLNELARQWLRGQKAWLGILSVCLLSYGLSFAQFLGPQNVAPIFFELSARDLSLEPGLPRSRCWSRLHPSSAFLGSLARSVESIALVHIHLSD
jgi:hypothetical protein